jgi:hypothetical protein
MMEQVMPPDPFKGLVAGLSTLIPATEWQEIEKRMPGLKAYMESVRAMLNTRRQNFNVN